MITKCRKRKKAPSFWDPSNPKESSQSPEFVRAEDTQTPAMKWVRQFGRFYHINIKQLYVVFRTRNLYNYI